MKTNLLKTMVVGAGLLTATLNANADEATATVKMTYVDGDNADTSYGEIASGETAKAGTNKISGGKVGWYNQDWGVNYVTYLQVDASAIEGTITKATLTAEVSGDMSNGNRRTATWGVGYNTSEWSSTLTDNTADKTITKLGSTYTTTTKVGTTFESASFDISAAFDGDEDKIVTILVYETAAGGGYIKNPVVTVEYSTGATASYTVKYVCGDTEVKTSTSGTGVVGNTYTVTDEDKASVTVDGTKYVYSSDDAASQTIAEDGSTVITVTFKEASSYTYTFNAVDGDGNSLKAGIVSGSALEGDAVNIGYPRYCLVDGTIYEAGKLSTDGKGYYKTLTLSKNVEEDITYSVTSFTNVVYFEEAEDIDGLTATTKTPADVRCSNAKGAYASSTDAITLTNLAAGTYKITAAVFGNSGATASFNYGESTFDIATTGSLTEKTSDEFTLTAATDITLTLTSSGSAKGLDYIFIQSIDPSTGINAINVENAAKSNVYYNISGQRVAKPSKGLYIVNGKKVVVK